MNKAFLSELNKKFPKQFELGENGEFVKFSAKSPGFGDVLIFEEEPGAYIMELGKFTHVHCDSYLFEPREFYDDVVWLLEEIFADRIICHGSHMGGGGYEEEEYWQPADCTDYFSWSGKYGGKREETVKNKKILLAEVKFYKTAHMTAADTLRTTDYRPHLVIENQTEYLGVQFFDGEDFAIEKNILAMALCVYDGVDY
ncbi:MAG: hypothetical protein FWG64_00135, partial [Firmicutes bacterium]|nr:hypothetical protein [Bacillota bacterium]